MTGHALIWPQLPGHLAFDGALASGAAIMDASTEEHIRIGRINRPDWVSGSKTIVGVESYVGAKNNGTGTTTVRVALCDVDLTTGNPARDDGVEDQTVDIAIASIPASGVWSSTFGASRTVSKGDLLAVRIRFTAYGTATPSLSLVDAGADAPPSMPAVTNIITTTYTARPAYPSVAFITDTGERLYFDPCVLPMVSSNWVDFNSGSTGTTIDGGDERGMLWVPSAAYDLTRFDFWARHNVAGGDSQLCVYRDTTLLEAMDMDATLAGALNNLQYWNLRPAAAIRVNAGENIRIVHKPTSTNAVRLYRNVLAHADDRVLFGTEQNVEWTNRVDAGAWNAPADATTSFPSLRIFGEPVTAGGGLITHPGMAGGLNA